MGRIPEETIREIRDRVDVVGLIGRYVELKKAGRNLKGLCPFHNEKTPSFNVQPDRQIFHCFGCGEGGDVITFLQRHDGLSFPEAARMLAARLEREPFVVDVDTSVEDDEKRVVFVTDKEKAALSGIGTDDIVQAARAMLT